MRRTLAILVLAALALAGCSLGDDDPQPGGPGASSEDEQAAEKLGFPYTATRNTVRVPGGDAAADAAGVASALFPATTEADRPTAVVLVDRGDWQSAVAASVLAGPPIAAPHPPHGRRRPAGRDVGHARPAGAARLRPLEGRPGDPDRQRRGAARAGTRPRWSRATTPTSAPPRSTASSRPRAGGPRRTWCSTRARRPSGRCRPPPGPPAPGDAALPGGARLGARADREGAARARPSERLRARTGAGRVEAGRGPAREGPRRLGQPRGRARPRWRTRSRSRAIARATSAGAWRCPGYNFAVASTSRPLDAAAAASLATRGVFAPLLLTDRAADLPPALESYFLSVQPGYEDDPGPGGLQPRLDPRRRRDHLAPRRRRGSTGSPS